MGPEASTLVAPGRVLVPLALAALAEAVAWAWLARAGTLDPGWYGRSDLLAGLHLLTVGVIGLAIVGAAWQLIPVVTARPAPGLPGSALLVALVLTIPGFLYGLAVPGGWMPTVAAGALVLTLEVRAGFVLVELRRGARPVRRAWLAAAEGSLGIGLVLGAELWLARAGHLTGIDSYALIPRHAAWMLGGWVGGWIVGVGSVLLPMFAVSREPSPRALGAAGVLWYGGLAVGEAWVWAAGAALAFALLLRAVATGLKRTLPMMQAGVGIAGLLAAIALAPLAAPDVTVAVAVALGVLPVVRGVTQRILPFLLWTHLFAGLPPAASARAPAPSALVPARLPVAQVLLSTVGALGVVAGRIDLPFARIGAALACAGALLHVAILAFAARAAWTGRRRLDAIPGLEAP